MHYISVREESGVRIIDELIHKKVDCFLDPVLLLDREQWEKMMRPTKFHLPGKFVLSFFLGEEPDKPMEIFAESHGLQVIHMNRREYKDCYLLAPDQMLYMIKNAAFIMTDSFHVTAFSIIFQKQFYVFRRREPGMENMFSRMETLLGKFSLTRRVQEHDTIEDREKISEEQYNEIGVILMKEQMKIRKVIEDKVFLNTGGGVFKTS